MELTPEELRVIGCLVEKQLTTPQQYPLTLNALVLACNQTSNREPVVAYDERTVETAVTRAKEQGLARFVHPSHGRSVLRYRHELDERFGLDERQLALLAVLVLRGPQTPGELRARTERMAPLADLAEVEAELAALADREERLVVRLPRQPGRKEDRYAHTLGADVGGHGIEGSPPPAGAQPDGAPPARPPTAGPGLSPVPAASPLAPVAPTAVPDAAELARDMASLRAEVGALRRELDDLRSQLGA